MSRAARPAVGRLLAGFALLVAYGSLYPFEFESPASTAQAWHDFVSSRRLWTSIGDVVGNVLLFVPLGALAALRLRAARPRWPLQLAGTVAAGVGFALALQVAQLWLPARSAALADVWWNAVGMLLGVGIALGWRLHASRGGAGQGPPPRVPAALLALWAAAQLAPFVPRLDWQATKDAIKPLLLAPTLQPLGLWLATAIALVLGCIASELWPDRRVAARRLVLLLGAALLSRLFISGRSLGASECAGFAAGFALWRLLGARPAGERLALAALFAGYTAAALMPLQWRAAPAPFHWLPFAAMLHGSMLINVWALLQALFFFAALLWLAQRAGLPGARGALLLALWVAALEVAQRWLVGRVADITPPLLVLATAAALAQVSLRTPARPAPRTPAAPSG